MLDRLDIDEMLALTAPWVEESSAREVFLSVSEIAPLYSKVVQAHEALAAAKTQRVPQTEMKTLIEEETIVDARHDHLARGIHATLEAHVHFLLSQDPPQFSRAATCQHALRKLFPVGLSIINASLLAESGNTARVGRMLATQEKALAEFLTTIPAFSPNKSLRDMVDAWIEAGTSLAELEHLRSSLALKEGAIAASSSPQAAKKAWNRIISQILLMLGVADAAPDVIHGLRGPFEEALQRASTRLSDAHISDEPTHPG
jgi:hypothetical protein